MSRRAKWGSGREGGGLTSPLGRQRNRRGTFIKALFAYGREKVKEFSHQSRKRAKGVCFSGNKGDLGGAMVREELEARGGQLNGC